MTQRIDFRGTDEVRSIEGDVLWIVLAGVLPWVLSDRGAILSMHILPPGTVRGGHSSDHVWRLPQVVG